MEISRERSDRIIEIASKALAEAANKAAAEMRHFGFSEAEVKVAMGTSGLDFDLESEVSRAMRGKKP